MGTDMWNVLLYPRRDDLISKAAVCRTFDTLDDAKQFIADELAALRGEAWNYGIMRVTCGYCRKRPAVGHDGMSAFCAECRK